MVPNTAIWPTSAPEAGTLRRAVAPIEREATGTLNSIISHIGYLMSLEYFRQVFHERTKVGVSGLGAGHFRRPGSWHRPNWPKVDLLGPIAKLGKPPSP